MHWVNWQDLIKMNLFYKEHPEEQFRGRLPAPSNACLPPDVSGLVIQVVFARTRFTDTK
jgi:hypothetical protein